MTYSVQFRKKVLKLHSVGESFIKLSKRFKISTTTISRWKKELNPKLGRNKRPTKIDTEALKKDIQDYPDSYSYERARRLGVSASGIKHAKRRIGVTYKKNLKSSESGCRKKIYVLPKN
jgi:transposase